MNTNISLNLNKTAIIALLMRLRTLLVSIAVISLAGYTLYQISLITAISPDPDTLNEERAKVDAARIKFDTATIQAIGKQNQVSPRPDLSNIGKTDPFYQ